MKRICKIQIPTKIRVFECKIPIWSNETCVSHVGYWAKMLLSVKEKLEIHPYVSNWVKFKEYVNKYERIYNASHTLDMNVSLHVPLSRSYFKMWELIHDFKLLKHCTGSIQSAHLAEGPGGFIEALCNFRRQYHPTCAPDDKYHGMTLLNTQNKDIPNWNKAHKLMRRFPNIVLHRGKDGTGNMYNVENIDHLVNCLGRQSCVLVTGDGGMDYSINYAKQENLSQRLILAQIYCALQLVQSHKHFVCKLFDTNEQFTQEMLWLLSVCFKTVYIVKPYTSRIANSERYVVACDFIECPDSVLCSLRHTLTTWQTNKHIQSICKQSMPGAFTNALHKYSEWHAKQQYIFINKGLDLIDRFGKKPYYTISKIPMLRNIIKHQKECAQQWCKKYNVPFKETI